MRRTLPLPAPVLLGAALLGGCTTASEPEAHVASVGRAPAGIERVMGREAAALTALFGPATIDMREGTARKLQFRGAACVLDAYLYAPTAGGAAQVTWIDARTPSGDDLDRASCIAALARR